MSYYVRTISDNAGWKDFLSLPYRIYKDDPNWIPQINPEVKRVLNPAKNPYFKNASLRMYVCYSDNVPVSRSIMVINRQHWAKWNKKSAFFGYFESYNDHEAVKCLFLKIEEECRSLGAEFLEGPFNPNHYSEMGIQLDNFNIDPIFFETHNPPYYSYLLNETGFSEIFRIHTRINRNIHETLSKSMDKIDPGDIGKDITIRKFNIRKMNRDLEILREINNEAFENNPFFLPLTMDEYRFSSRFLFLVTTPGLILFAEYKGKPVGAIQYVINFNRLVKPLKGRIMPWHLPGLLLKRNKVKELVIYSVGIKKAFRHTRISAMLIKSGIKIFQKYSTVSTTWIYDDNRSIVHIAELFDMKPHKYFGIYSKPLRN
jgi:ribosomal protein S18 acetylase RimI-like enzyme